MLFIHKEDLTVGKFPMGEYEFDTTIAYGNNSSIMCAERPAGYHSKPHIHACEQINIVLEGECVMFVGGKGVRMKKGDYNRTPANELHWCWNQSDKPVVLLEVHSPGLQSDPKCKEYATPLFEEGEKQELLGEPVNVFVDYDEEWLKEVEKPFMNE